MKFWLLVLGSLLLACSSSNGSGTADESDPAQPAPSTTTTMATPTTIENRHPVIEVISSARADVGGTWSDAIVASDPDGDPIQVTVGDMPLGFFPTTNSRGLINGFEWRPPDAGVWSVEISVTDARGLSVSQAIELVGRYPRDVDLMLVVGDGVAAGEGLDRTDLLRRNDCGRAESEAFPRLAFDTLRTIGSLSDDAEIVFTACNGMSAAGLAEDAIEASNGDGDSVTGEWTSLEWAVRLNPTIVTVTAGAVDVGRSDPDELIIDGEVDIATLQSSVARMTSSLQLFVSEVLERTDAHVVLTTYADPTASNPRGVDDCRGACFSEAMARIHEELNRGIVDAVPPDWRVSYALFDGALDDHRAGDPVGLNLLRAPAPCAADDEPEESWVSNVDCLKPNEQGHVVLADLLWAALDL